MTELLTAAQMRAIEAAAIASGEVTGLELMERAGRGVVEAIFAEWPELKATSHRAVVLCGPGNNGGDGFVVARLLKEWGWEVEVFLYGDPDRLPPDARVNYERWVGMGEVSPCAPTPVLMQMRIVESLVAEDVPLVAVDALVGTGATRSLAKTIGPFDFLFRNRLRHRNILRVAIDLPSGTCADSGSDLGNGYCGDLTVTFHRPKIGHLIAEGPERAGKLRTVDLGLSQLEGVVELTEFFPNEVNKNAGHKYSHGHALILSGPSGRGGAARLAARGALRIGAGVVTVGCPLDAIPEHAARLDAVMLRGVVDGLALEETLTDPRINALCVGPGLGLDARGRELVGVALESRG
ncbi:MAG: NAD(P)H-hydrate epimerase, partial [Pseudomonadota bacterium]